MGDESCRILTISSTIEVAAAFIESVKALAASSSSTSSSLEKLSVPLTVPWTITNRYYVADVHFSAWSMDRFFPELLEREPPALVFVWSEGQPYVKHVKEIARLMKLREYEPEVALAVRIPFRERENAEGIDRFGEDGQNEDENRDLDGMLMSYGFEYVDATQRIAEGDLAENGREDDIPALPRVLDALSTIIWPSMQSNKVERGVRGPLDFNRSFDEADSGDGDLEKEKEGILRELLEDDGLCASPVDEIAEEADEELMDRMEAVMLDGEWNRPWISVSDSSRAVVSEMTRSMSGFERQLEGEQGTPGKEKVTLGFDDDFSVFVSAPAQEEKEKKVSEAGLDAGMLVPDGGFRYRTLGSVSDFGESDDGRGPESSLYERLGDEDLGSDGEDSAGMPSTAEIKDTARKIYGGGRADLDEVFGVLEEYKTEIASIEHEDEKRKTAARVALGLVYGLDYH